MSFRIKVNQDTFDKKGPYLCCAVNEGATCSFCKEKMCIECAKAWSPRKHFVLDMCRKRFTPEQLEESNKCYSDRVKKAKGSDLVGLGDCDVCKERKISRGAMNDRVLYEAGEEHDYWSDDEDIYGPQ